MCPKIAKDAADVGICEIGGGGVPGYARDLILFKERGEAGKRGQPMFLGRMPWLSRSMVPKIRSW